LASVGRGDFEHDHHFYVFLTMKKELKASSMLGQESLKLFNNSHAWFSWPMPNKAEP
jgi:hypothetical protein